MSITIRSSYMRHALDYSQIRDHAADALKGVEFDTVIGTGLSGLLPLALLADQFGVAYAAVRKPSEPGHANKRMEGTLGDRWLFVDDFISSGNTFVRVLETVYETAKDMGHKTECAGMYSYERPNPYAYQTFKRVQRSYPRVNRRWSEITAPKVEKPEPTKVEGLDEPRADWESILYPIDSSTAAFAYTPILQGTDALAFKQTNGLMINVT